MEFMNRLYNQRGFQMAVLYGRRRVGKTTILSHFVHDREAVFFAAAETGDRGNLRRFSRDVLSHFGMADVVSDFADWETAFRFVGKQAAEKRIVLVIDEFPYLAAGNSGILSILQNIIDHEWLGGNLFLILCGSTMRFMENEVLGYKSPLFGRRTGQLKIEPFDYWDASAFMGGYSPQERIAAYSVFGGTPHYLSRIDSSISLADNIMRCFLERGAYLYDEPVSILKQEMREPALYNALIEVIANGATRLNEIATKVGEDSNKCAKYINALIGLGFLEKETPYGAKETGRRSLYCIRDPFFSFWYRFVFPNMSLIEAEMGGHVLEQRILPELDSFTGRLFEQVCREFYGAEIVRGNYRLYLKRLGGLGVPICRTKRSMKSISLRAIRMHSCSASANGGMSP